MSSQKIHNLIGVMIMKSNKEILTSILKTAQMGQVGIRSVIEYSTKSSLKNSLVSQLQEYDAIETEAHRLAGQRGWEITDLDPVIRKMTDMTARLKISGRNPDSRIAEMMIQGSMRGVIKGLRNTHQFSSNDEPIADLSQKLLDTETSNIQQMKNYL